MSIFEIEDMLILDEGSAKLKEQYDRYCDWCWGCGFGNCSICKKVFLKYYISIRKAELQARLFNKHNSKGEEE